MWPWLLASVRRPLPSPLCTSSSLSFAVFRRPPPPPPHFSSSPALTPPTDNALPVLVLADKLKNGKTSTWHHGQGPTPAPQAPAKTSMCTTYPTITPATYPRVVTTKKATSASGLSRARLGGRGETSGTDEGLARAATKKAVAKATTTKKKTTTTKKPTATKKA